MNYSGGRFSEAAKIGSEYYLDWKKQQKGLTKEELVDGWKQYKKDNIETIMSARQRLLKNIKDRTLGKKINTTTKQIIKDELLKNDVKYRTRYNHYGKNEGIGRDEYTIYTDKNDGVMSRNIREKMKILRKSTLNNGGYKYGIDFTDIYNNALMNVRNAKQLLLNKEYGTTNYLKPYRIATISNDEKAVIVNNIHDSIMDGIDTLKILKLFENISEKDFDRNFRFLPEELIEFDTNNLNSSRKERKKSNIPIDKTLEIIEEKDPEQLPEQIIEPIQYLTTPEPIKYISKIQRPPPQRPPPQRPTLLQQPPEPIAPVATKKKKTQKERNQERLTEAARIMEKKVYQSRVKDKRTREYKDSILKK